MAAKPHSRPNLTAHPLARRITRPLVEGLSLFGLIMALATASAAPPTHYWHDGNRQRPLTLDRQFEADFSPTARAAARADVLRRVDPVATKSTIPAPFQSPVFRDETGQPRALPGGVIVVLQQPLDEAAARALFARAGVTPTQRLHDDLWLVASPAGMPSLDLANRLHASGLFKSAEPNWWTPRALK